MYRIYGMGMRGALVNCENLKKFSEYEAEVVSKSAGGFSELGVNQQFYHV
jgi:hypothetical protein